MKRENKHLIYGRLPIYSPKRPDVGDRVYRVSPRGFADKWEAYEDAKTGNPVISIRLGNNLVAKGYIHKPAFFEGDRIATLFPYFEDVYEYFEPELFYPTRIFIIEEVREMLRQESLDAFF